MPVPADTDLRARRIVRSVVLDTLVPLFVAGLIVALLTDTIVNRIDPSELKTNTLLMGSRPIRMLSDAQSFAVALASSAVLLLAALSGAIVIGVPMGIAYAWSRNRPLRAFAWSVSTVAASLPAFFWAVGLELAMLVVFFRTGVRLLPIAASDWTSIFSCLRSRSARVPRHTSSASPRRRSRKSATPTTCGRRSRKDSASGNY